MNNIDKSTLNFLQVFLIGGSVQIMQAKVIGSGYSADSQSMLLIGLQKNPPERKMDIVLK